MPIINIYGPAEGVGFAVVSGIINETGRSVTFHASSGIVTCPTCLGQDPFCPMCGGKQKIELLYTRDEIASVRWKPSEDKRYRPTSQIIEGDCQIIVVFSDTVEDMLRNCSYVDVDERRCVVDKWYRKGSPINRVHIVLYEDKDLGGTRKG